MYKMFFNNEFLISFDVSVLERVQTLKLGNVVNAKGEKTWIAI